MGGIQNAKKTLRRFFKKSLKVLGYNKYMSPRNFSKTYHSPYFQSEHYKETDSYKNELKVEMFLYRLKINVLSIPRRFWGGIKKTFK